jgi:hypothetical protein
VAETRKRLLAAARYLALAQVASEEAETLRIRTTSADLSDQERLLQRVAHLRRIVVPRPRVRRLRRLEEGQDVLRTRGRPRGEQVMV